MNIIINKETLKHLIDKNPLLLSMGSDALRGDKDLVFQATLLNPQAFQYASDILKKDKDFIIFCISHPFYSKEIVKILPVSLLEDGAFVLSILKVNPFLIESISAAQSNLEVASIVVKDQPSTLCFFSPSIQENEAILLPSLKYCPDHINFLSEEKLSDKSFAMRLLDIRLDFFKKLPAILRSDRDIILKVGCKNMNLISHYSLLKGYQTFEEIVEKEGESFLFSCWNNEDRSANLIIANHQNFIPTIEQYKKVMEDFDIRLKRVFEIRKEEWLAKWEENALKLSYQTCSY